AHSAHRYFLFRAMAQVSSATLLKIATLMYGPVRRSAATTSTVTLIANAMARRGETRWMVVLIIAFIPDRGGRCRERRRTGAGSRSVAPPFRGPRTRPAAANPATAARPERRSRAENT